MTQADVQNAGGPSSAKVRELENGRTTTLSPSKRRDLERALEWQEGSVDTVLSGGAPTLADAPGFEAVGVDDQGEELFTLPGARQYDFVTLRDGTRMPFPSDLIAEADVARNYLAHHGGPITDDLRKILPILQAVVDHADLATLYERIERLTRDQMLELSRFVDQLLKENLDDITQEPTPESSTSQAHQVEKTPAANGRHLSTAQPDTGNGEDLIEPDPGSEVDADNHQREVDLAGGWRRGGGKSETRQAREDQDEAAEDGGA